MLIQKNSQKNNMKKVSPPTRLAPAFLAWFFFWLLFVLTGFSLTSCKDDCEATITYQTTEPVYRQVQELRDALGSEPARQLEEPGKIYVHGHYLFINEHQKGLHVIDNSNPAAPRNVAFFNIPGNVDLAVKGNILYADSYMDLVALDISNPENITLLKRVESVFSSMYSFQHSEMGANLVLVDYAAKTVMKKIKSDCNAAAPPSANPVAEFDSGFRSLAGGGSGAKSNTGGASAGTSNNGSGTGKGGSMARFTLYGNFLYTVGLSNLQLFNITDPANPTASTNLELGWGIETIFPHEDKLFIGSTTGMHIYDIANPANPKHLSTYEHVRSCDPVVVYGSYAYVTLRSGTACQGFTNQLDLINISDLKNPKLVKSYPMQNPHGLGIDNKTLFLCEGSFGLKVFDIQDPTKIDQNLLRHFKNINAYDVIPLNQVLMMIGQDGLYQYDYSDPKNLTLLSRIPVVKAI